MIDVSELLGNCNDWRAARLGWARLGLARLMEIVMASNPALIISKRVREELARYLEIIKRYDRIL